MPAHFGTSNECAAEVEKVEVADEPVAEDGHSFRGPRVQSLLPGAAGETLAPSFPRQYRQKLRKITQILEHCFDASNIILNFYSCGFQTRFSVQYEQAQSNCWLVCIPTAASLEGCNINKQFVGRCVCVLDVKY